MSGAILAAERMGYVGAPRRGSDNRSFATHCYNEVVISIVVFKALLSSVTPLAKGVKAFLNGEKYFERKLYKERLTNCLSVMGVGKVAGEGVDFFQGIFAFGNAAYSGRISSLGAVASHLPSVKTVSDFVGDAVDAAKFFGVTPDWAESVSTGADVVYYAMDFRNVSGLALPNMQQIRDVSMRKLVDLTRVICSLAVAIFKAIELFYGTTLLAASTVAMIAFAGAVAGVSTAYFGKREVVLRELS